ncbi:hypothetical protein [Methylomonas methanica]|uniref:Uncharacterized protein n=1 Tax=Methylomonas methanica (strain DSM 25384 / MC09) TaxID=857087 RepID=G0A300_METMM|nr:hypothetical protein [Methylomonas methanica]AEG02659.1 hypothetical protein Metme_4310 [Methylomonas methanica MC09]
MEKNIGESLQKLKARLNNRINSDLRRDAAQPGYAARYASEEK